MAAKCFTEKQLNFPQLGDFYLNYSIYEIATYLSRAFTASTQEVIHCTLSLSCVLNKKWIIELHWQQSMWKGEKQQKDKKKLKKSARKWEKFFTYTEPYKFINE